MFMNWRTRYHKPSPPAGCSLAGAHKNRHFPRKMGNLAFKIEINMLTEEYHER